MKKLRMIICLVLAVALLGSFTAALADMDEGMAPEIINDSDNELLEESSPVRRPLLKSAPPAPAPTPVPEHYLSSSAFIADPAKSAYVDRMMSYYIENGDGVKDALLLGQPVVMFFEGASDNPPSDETYRDGAVVITVKYDSANEEFYIATHCCNCTTMPDYPFGYEYDNGHENYGAGILLDGIYDFLTVNHRKYYAAFAVHAGVSFCVPGLYMKNDGTFSVMNANGINIHTRTTDSVSGDILTPRTAGCLLIGDSADYAEYMNFLMNTWNSDTQYMMTTFNDNPILKYDQDNWVYTGKVVVDRYLARDYMRTIYKNADAVECITANSTLAQADLSGVLNSVNAYPTYADITLEPSSELLSFPSPSASVLKTTADRRNTSMIATGTFDNGGNIFYRVLSRGRTYFVSADSVTDIALRYDDITIHHEISPEVKQVGKSFAVSGIISKTFNELNSVSGKIVTDGVTKCSPTASGSDILASYSLNGEDGHIAYSDTIDYKMAFSSLPLGESRYTITALIKNYYESNGVIACEDKTVTIVDKPFVTSKFVITLKDQNGKYLGLVPCNNDCKLSDMPAFEADGVQFDGWYNAPEGGNTITTNTVFSANTTIYAHYTPIGTALRQYTLTFDSCGGSSVSPVTAGKGTFINTEKLIPTKNGFTFDGWYYDRFYIRPVINLALNNDLTVYAKWSKTGASFTDISEDDWFCDDVKYVFDAGLMSGTADGIFNPYLATSRGMFITTLYRIDGESAVSSACPFNDVKEGSYCEKAIIWAYENGILTGAGGRKASPDSALTREQAAAILCRYAAFKGINVSGASSIARYPDSSSVSAYAVQALSWACDCRIISGANGMLLPANALTRAQCAAILHRFCAKLA